MHQTTLQEMPILLTQQAQLLEMQTLQTQLAAKTLQAHRTIQPEAPKIQLPRTA